MFDQASSPSLIPVLVTGIQQRHARAAHDQSKQRMRFEVKRALTGLPTQADWIPVTSTGMRTLVASAPTAIGMTESMAA